jgi:hypothetical protein
VKCRLYTKTHVITLESEGDFWETHCKLVEAMGIKDLGPVVDEKHAAQIVALSVKRMARIAVQGVGNGTNTGKTSRKVKS